MGLKVKSEPSYVKRRGSPLDNKHLCIFQELPKYLRGYHVCTKEDMINIAALLFRVKVGSDKTQLPMIPKMLKELVPADQLKTISENEWKRVQKLIG